MANPEDLKALDRDATDWNVARKSRPNWQPDLSGADLSGRDLRRFNLSNVDLSYANLRGADLRGAVLRDSAMSGVNLAEAEIDALTDFAGAYLHPEQSHLSARCNRRAEAKTLLDQLHLFELAGRCVFGFCRSCKFPHAWKSGEPPPPRCEGCGSQDGYQPRVDIKEFMSA